MCLGEPASEWRSRESRWAQTGNGPAAKTPEREGNERETRTWEDTGWLETERQDRSGVVNRGDLMREAERVRSQSPHRSEEAS